MDLDFRKVVDVTVAGRPIPTGANLSPGKITRRVAGREMADRGPKSAERSMSIMVSSKQSIHIDAPVEKVFDFMKDPANWEGFERGIVFKNVKPTPEGVGTRYEWVARVAGFRIKGSGVFTEFIPNQRIRDMTSPSFEGSWAYLFQAEDSGMRLTVEHFPGSFGRIPLLGRLAERLGSKGHARVLSKLKARMEA